MKSILQNSLRVAMVESIYCSNAVKFCYDIVRLQRSRQLAFLLGWYTCLAGSQRRWCVCWTIYYGQDKLCSCSHKQTHCTNAFCILSVHEVGYQTADRSGLMICAWLSDMYDSNLQSQWTCTVLWHCMVNPCGVWHQSFFSKVLTLWCKPLSKPVYFSDGRVNGPMVKPFFA